MPAAARTIYRRYNGGVPVFTVSSEAVRREVPGGRANVHDVGDFPDVQGLMSSRTGVWTVYPVQMLKLRRTQELGCCAGFGSSPRRQVITSGRPTPVELATMPPGQAGFILTGRAPDVP